MTDEHWYSISVGGPMAATSLLVHASCGAVVADRIRHAQVCTAPPAQGPASRVGETRDWYNGWVRS